MREPKGTKVNQRDLTKQLVAPNIAAIAAIAV